MLKTLPTQFYQEIDSPRLHIDTTGATMVAIDIEMYGQDKDRLHIPHGKFASLALALDNGNNYVVTSVSGIRAALEDVEHLQWIIQNATYDIRQLRQFVTIEPRPIFDPMLVEKVLWSGYYVLTGLSSMVRRYLGLYVAKDKYDEIRDETIDKVILYQYNMQDSVLTLKVAQSQQLLLEQRPDSKKVYWTIDAPMIWVVLDMPPTRVNVEGWMELAKENESKGRSIEAEIGMNVYSYKKVKEILASQYGILLNDTADETLAEYKHLPVIQKIREARTYRKAASTYGEKWISNFADENGLVHCNWNVTGAMTGRMSSDSPNLQNIPSRKMPIFRTLFIPQYDRLIIADVSQQEPRITALQSKDKNLMDAFANGEDIHLFVARTIFEDPTIEKTDPRRKIGKEVGLGVVYGLTAIGLTAKLKEVIEDPAVEISEEKSQGYIDAYFEKFPRVKNMLDRWIADGHRDEYVTTYFGRRSYINIHAMGWENNCRNSPIQGGGADMTKLWQVKLWELCRKENVRYPLVMPIHDELVLDVKEEEVEMFIRLLQDAFGLAIDILYPDTPVPFEFEFAVGENWSAKK